jgi:integrase
VKGISIFQRTGSPCWLAAFWCPKKLKRVSVSTGFRLDDPSGRHKAFVWAQARHGVDLHLPAEHERWEAWAPQFLRDRYEHQPKTLTSYLGAWKFLGEWLHLEGIHTPGQLHYDQLGKFIAWRTGAVKRSGKRTGRNTALHNLKVLSRLMREAIRRGWAQSNPCARLGDDLPSEPAPLKRELSDEEIDRIRLAFREREGKGRPSDWMEIAFEVAIHQGCRLSATAFPLTQVDWQRETLTLHEKGTRGKKAVFTVPIHPGLMPLLRRLREEGRERTWTATQHASRNFTRFLREIGIHGASFHCTRVTVITRMARAGVPIQQAIAYVHHADSTIHKVYQRLQAQDLKSCHDALRLGGQARG